MNAINLDITDDLRDYDSYVSRRKFYVRQALSQKYYPSLIATAPKPRLSARSNTACVQSGQE